MSADTLATGMFFCAELGLPSELALKFALVLGETADEETEEEEGSVEKVEEGR